MPVMDGIELAHKASANHPDLKILLMTGYAEQRERADDLMEKIVDVVSKPFSLPDIRTRSPALSLRRRRPEREALRAQQGHSLTPSRPH